MFTQEDVGHLWDTSDSPYQYKGAALGVFKKGTAFTTEFIQWDGPDNPNGQTYWFALNTKVVTPVVEIPATATITKTTVKPVKPEPVSAELVKAKNPVKPTLALKTLSETKNQKLSASYHGYKLQYKPVVRKSVADTDKTNTNGQTVAKNATQLYTLHHDNIYANLKKGDKITIIDPLEAGAVPDVAVTKAAAEKAGWDVAYDSGKNTYTFTATYEGKRLAAPVISWKPIYDKGFYDNTYKVLVNKYEVYSNTVTTKTPKPPKPVKAVLDRSGKDINGATTFDRNVTFRLVTDYSPYTKTLASAQALGKKFAILDDVQDGAFSVYQGNIKMTAAGKDVKSLFDMHHVLSDKGRTDAINKILKELNLQPRGEFYLWVAKDSKSFYHNYVKQNKNVTIDLPAKLLVKAGEKVKNDFKQIDFAVEVPNVKPEKHVLDRTGKKVLDGKEVQLGDFVQYLLDGVTVPEKHDTLYQYDGVDKLDTKHDRYTGNWKGIIKGTEYTAEKELVLPYDVTLKNGKVIKAGDKISKGSSYAFTFEFNQGTNSEFIKKLVTVKWDAKGGQWSYVINQDFLNSLGIKGTFDADFYIEAERIETGDKIENTFINIVNKQEMTAKVITRTPEPPKPKHPEKHALDKTGQKVLDGKEVQLGELIQYLLDGVTIPERHHTLYQYDGVDKLDMKHDRYTGNWKGIIKGTEYTAEKDLTLPYDVILKNGKVIKAGDKIAKGSSYAFTFEFNQGTNSDFIKKIVKVTWSEQDGKWAYTIDKEFLNSLGVKGSFDADFYIEVERIAAGEVENTFVNIVNGQEMTAKVTTHTPPKPEEPGKPNPQPSLPNTGSAASMLPFVGMILGLLSLAGLRKSKEN